MPFNTFVNEREETQIGIMNSTNEWCTDKLSKLLNEELRISTLSEIKEHFASISSNEAVETANLLELPLVFDCLNDSNTYVEYYCLHTNLYQYLCLLENKLI